MKTITRKTKVRANCEALINAAQPGSYQEWYFKTNLPEDTKGARLV